MKRVLIATLVTMAVASAAAIGMAQTASPAAGAAPANPSQSSAMAAPMTATVGGDVKREMADVPVRRVVLFSSGVGFFQHSGKVTGNAATELRFKTDQINDILKSLVVSDTAAGVVKSITYGSQNPVSRTLKSFQIDISANPSWPTSSTRFAAPRSRWPSPTSRSGHRSRRRGEAPPHRPTLQARRAKGRQGLIRQRHHVRGNPQRAARRRQTLQIEDDALQKELDQALAALAQARDKDKKPVIVNFDGTGERPVGIAYLVETPVWKTSYRLILPGPRQPGQRQLLGWAIVENQTDNDWNNVTLDLVGGRPDFLHPRSVSAALCAAARRPAQDLRQPDAANLRRA